MKITYIVDGFPKLSETFVLNQITGLIDRGHQVEVIACYHPGEEQVHEDIKRYGLLERVRYLNWKEGKGIIEAKNAEAIAPCLDADVVHAHFLARPADTALDMLHRVGIPYVVTAHAYDIFINPDVERLRERCNDATRVLTVSEYNRTYMIKLLGEEFGERIFVHRLGVDLKRFPYIDRSGRMGKNVTILFVGRLVEKKGPLDALESFASLRQKVPGVRLVMIGDGPLANPLDERINELGISNCVERVGAATTEQVTQRMTEADIFLLPSRTCGNGDREGLPVVLMEALAMGLPAISTRHSGIPELIEDGVSGVLADEGDVKGLTESLVSLATSPNLRLEFGRAGREQVEKAYDLNQSLDALEKHLLVAAVPKRLELGERLARYLPAVIAEVQRHTELLEQRTTAIEKRVIALEKLATAIKQEDKLMDIRIRRLENALERIQSTFLFRIYAYFRGRSRAK